MLLSQCLAISLSECKSPLGSLSLSPESNETRNKIHWTDLDEERISRRVSENTSLASDSVSSASHNSTNQSIGRVLFEKLVERNSSANKISQNDPLSNRTESIVRPKDESELLYSALRRTHLAGFVVPSWLLVSGALEDLQVVRNSWSLGTLQAPVGMRIDAIGKSQVVE